MKKTFFFLLTPFLFFIFLVPLNIVSADLNYPSNWTWTDPNDYLEPIERKEQEKKEYKEEHPILYYFKYPIHEHGSTILFLLVGLFSAYWVSLLITLIIELLAAELILLFTSITRKVLLSVALANVFSLLFMFLALFFGVVGAKILFSSLGIDSITNLLLGIIILLEIIIILIEFYLIPKITKKFFNEDIPKKFSFFLSLIINLVSGVVYIIYLTPKFLPLFLI